MACMAEVEVESLVISTLALLRVDPGSVEVHAIHVHCVDVLHFAALVAIVMVVAFVRLFYVFLVDRQLVDHLHPSGTITTVLLGNLEGNQLL
jgi:hypothetical protein